MHVLDHPLICHFKPRSAGIKSQLDLKYTFGYTCISLGPVTIEPAMAVDIDYVVRGLLYYRLPKASKCSVGRWPGSFLFDRYLGLPVYIPQNDMMKKWINSHVQ